MTFYVQKADGTCVGPNCSTYLTNWDNGSGGKGGWAANISPSLNNQLMPGQHWTMTIQNTEEGYNGYLDSPSGQMTENSESGPLPAADGNTPAGAQFKLQTQAEITAQPKWAVVTETVVGAIVGLSIVGVAGATFYGAYVATAEVAEGVLDTYTLEVSASLETEAGEATDGTSLYKFETENSVEGIYKYVDKDGEAWATGYERDEFETMKIAGGNGNLWYEDFVGYFN
jgi:hypothetical protein